MKIINPLIRGTAIAIGFTPGDDLESAMVATLPPSAYTAIVAGKGGTGVALVEIYNLQ